MSDDQADPQDVSDYPDDVFTGFSDELRPTHIEYRLARWTLAAFVTTFIAARILVILIMTRRIPDLYAHVGGTHVHHLNYGIFLLSGVAGYLVFFQPRRIRLRIAAAIYGIGLALTFDEFGMWLHLGGSYWQRASFDAVVVIAGLLGLFSVAPAFRSFKPRHWTGAVGVSLLSALFAVLLVYSVHEAGNGVVRLQVIEENQPQ